MHINVMLKYTSHVKYIYNKNIDLLIVAFRIVNIKYNFSLNYML